MTKKAIVGAGFALLIFTSSVFSATFTVTTVSDTNDGTCDGDCSFREAVGAAVAAAGDDIIVFDDMVFSTPQTITLSGSEIVITASGTLTISGPGTDLLTISGGGLSRIIANTAGSVTTISGITFTAGNGVGALNTGRGGAIYNNASTLTVNDSIFTANSAANGGAVNAAGTATTTYNNCIFDGNSSTGAGGALQNFSGSTLTITNSTISNNIANSTITGGGGIQANGTVTVVNTTFSGNTAVDSGGGIYYNGQGLFMTNVTIANNTSANDGGGIHKATSTLNAFIRNNIIAGNTGTAASTDATGAFNSEGHNLIGAVGTSTGWVGSDLLDTDPLLGPLQDNGGPSLTHSPMPGSPAIDAGDDCVLDLSCSTNNPPFAVTTDQRASLRPMGPSVDIGSVEAASVASVSGRFMSSLGPVQGALVTISDMSGVVQSGWTNSFGYFELTGIPTGQTYELGALTKAYVVCTQSIEVNTNVTGVVLTTSGPAARGFRSPDFKVEAVGCLK